MPSKESEGNPRVEDQVVDLDQERQRQQIKLFHETGKKALGQLIEGVELVKIDYPSEKPEVSEFLDSLSRIAHTIYAERGITSRGIGFFMIHRNKLLGGLTPLEACAVGEYELAQEAGLCFVDPERAFAQGVENRESRIKEAASKISQAYL